jgi:hypothetical protein
LCAPKFYRGDVAGGGQKAANPPPFREPGIALDQLCGFGAALGFDLLPKYRIHPMALQPFAL